MLPNGPYILFLVPIRDFFEISLTKKKKLCPFFQRTQVPKSLLSPYFQKKETFYENCKILEIL